MLVISSTLETSQLPMSWLKLVAPPNIPDISVTLETSQLPMSWLKLVAEPNIANIVFTLDTSQLPMSWLKLVAEPNILDISATPETSQLPMFWLKLVAELNIEPILVTADTFQLPIFWLKLVALLNIAPMFITLETSQLFILLTVVKEVQLLNILGICSAFDKLRVPVTPVNTKLEHPQNIPLKSYLAKIFEYSPLNCPHCSICLILSLSPELLNLNPVTVPFITIVYNPVAE